MISTVQPSLYERTRKPIAFAWMIVALLLIPRMARRCNDDLAGRLGAV